MWRERRFYMAPSALRLLIDRKKACLGPGPRGVTFDTHTGATVKAQVVGFEGEDLVLVERRWL